MNRRVAPAAALLAAAVIASACGGSSAPAGPPTLQQAANEADVTLVGQPRHEEIFAHQTQDIAGHGGSCELATFASSAARDYWIKAGSEFGGYIIKKGDLWAISCT